MGRNTHFSQSHVCFIFPEVEDLPHSSFFKNQLTALTDRKVGTIATHQHSPRRPVQMLAKATLVQCIKPLHPKVHAARMRPCTGRRLFRCRAILSARLWASTATAVSHTTALQSIDAVRSTMPDPTHAQYGPRQHTGHPRPGVFCAGPLRPLPRVCDEPRAYGQWQRLQTVAQGEQGPASQPELRDCESKRGTVGRSTLACPGGRGSR